MLPALPAGWRWAAGPWACWLGQCRCTAPAARRAGEEYIALHEAGHAWSGHALQESYGAMERRQEAEAWAWASAHVRHEQRLGLWMVAVACMATYEARYAARRCCPYGCEAKGEESPEMPGTLACSECGCTWEV